MAAAAIASVAKLSASSEDVGDLVKFDMLREGIEWADPAIGGGRQLEFHDLLFLLL